jgi:hypothetical protein
VHGADLTELAIESGAADARFYWANDLFDAQKAHFWRFSSLRRFAPIQPESFERSAIRSFETTATTHSGR